MKNIKCLEYYLDSKIYNYESVQKSIDETKKEYNKKEIKVNIELNKYGMYIITFYFNNRNTFFNKIKLYFRKKQKPMLQTENKNNKHQYGKYKEKHFKW